LYTTMGIEGDRSGQEEWRFKDWAGNVKKLSYYEADEKDGIARKWARRMDLCSGE
jgi:hypothetical protein